MRIHFAITGPGGTPIVAGGEPTETDDLSAWSNHSSVVRLLRAAHVAPGRGQRLTMWIEDDPPPALLPDQAIDHAAESFHDALGTHLDYAGGSCSRPDDWVDAPVTAVVEALLLSGWTPPTDHHDPAAPPDPRAKTGILTSGPRCTQPALLIALCRGSSPLLHGVAIRGYLPKR